MTSTMLSEGGPSDCTQCDFFPYSAKSGAIGLSAPMLTLAAVMGLYA